MAPGVNDAGGTSKNKCTGNRNSASGSRSRVPFRDVLANATTLPWESESERRRRPVNSSHTHGDAAPCACQGHQQTRHEPRHSTASSTSLVDNDNGELSWSLNQHPNQSQTVIIRPQGRGGRPVQWVYSAPMAQSPPQGSSGIRPPNRQQVANKLTALQGYIEQTESVMRELRASDAPGCADQYEKLSSMLADLRDSERKLQALLRTMDNVDAKIDQLLSSSAPQEGASNGGASSEEMEMDDEHCRKVFELVRQREELIKMHKIARQRLLEVEQDRAGLVQRAQAIQVAPGADEQLVERVNRISEVFREPAERPDEDRAEAEVSDTETDYQLMREKGEELINLKLQLEQMQNMVAALGSASGSRVSSKDFEEAKAMVSRVQELNRMVDTVRMQGREPPEQQRGQRSVENEMASMTRQLEAQTVKMKEERDSIAQARAQLEKLKRLAAARVNSSADESDNESEGEPPTLLPANLVSTPRNMDGEGSSRSGSQKPVEGNGVRVPPRSRQRSLLNQSLPTLVNVPPETLDRRRKEPRSSQSSVRNGDMSGARTADWSPDMINQEAIYQTQNHLEESAQLCEQMLQESAGQGAGSVSSAGPSSDLTGMLYSQQQQLARTVSQCCKLIWMQQRQINELRNTLMLQQSANAQQQHPAAPLVPPPVFSAFPPPMAGDARPPMPAHLVAELMQLGLYPPTADSQANARAHLLDVLDAGQMGPSSALNNQVPPGNRANNYWDNFRSYSRQNLLSTSKSNENSDPRRQAVNQDRTPQAIVPPNNQAHYPVVQVQPLRQAEGDLEIDHSAPSGAESLNTRNNRTCEVVGRRGEAEGARCRNNQGSSRNRPQPNGRRDASEETLRTVPPNRLARNWARRYMQDEDSFVPPPTRNNEVRSRFFGYTWDDPTWLLNNSVEGSRNRTRSQTREDGATHSEDNLNCVRNDTGATPRNRASGSDHTEVTMEDIDRPNNRFAVGNLNNQQPNPLRVPTSVYQEVTSFIRANETRPNFLIQLFRDLQQVNSDPQRQRALQSLQDVLGANNITHEARNNNLHDNRSNLRRLSEETAAVEELFDQLRENQNTIRQSIGREGLEQIGNNLENPNISNIRELSQQMPPAASSSSSSTSRNNLDHNRMRDLQSYFEGNLCHMGPGSSLKNPNLSNIRENLTLSDYQQMTPKNTFRSINRLVEDIASRSQDPLFRDEAAEAPLIPESVDRFFMMAGREETEGGEFNMEDRADNGFLLPIDFHRDQLTADNADSDVTGRKHFLFSQHSSQQNPGTEDDDPTSLRRHWPPPSLDLPTEHPYTMFVRPVRYQQPAVHTADDADLAEADQTRSSAVESISMFVNRLVKEEDGPMSDVPAEESPPEDTLELAAMRLMEASYSTEADANENLVANEGNNNVIKCSAKNRRDAGCEGGAAKVTKARLQDVLCGAADGEAVANPSAPIPLMDMAGALEHLTDLLPQREEAGSFVANCPNLGMEGDAEREAGLDQVPTRLHRSDSANGDRDPM